MRPSSPQYTAIASLHSESDVGEEQNELHKDEERLLGHEQIQSMVGFSEPSSLSIRVFTSRRTLAANILLLFFSIVLLLLSLYLRTQNTSTCPESSITSGATTCPQSPILYSPAMQAVEYYDANFGGSKDYIGRPTKEKEQLWKDFLTAGAVVVPTEMMSQLHRSHRLDRYLKADPKDGDGYKAVLQVFHMLHCLNVLRQFTWYLAGAYPEELVPEIFTEGEWAGWEHFEHCIEILRLELMCQANVNPMLLENHPAGDRHLGAPEGHSFQRCRNFDRIKEWNVANKIVH